jgi:hypothetical protein
MIVGSLVLLRLVKGAVEGGIQDTFNVPVGDIP